MYFVTLFFSFAISVTKIHHNCPPCIVENCKTYEGKGNLVIEMPGGTCKQLNIRKGNNVTFSKK